MEYLYIIQQVLIWIITIFWVYQIGISLCSLVKLKEKPIVNEKKNKFIYVKGVFINLLHMKNINFLYTCWLEVVLKFTTSYLTCF